jgi:hypothetical protein
MVIGWNGVVAVAGVDTILLSADGHTWSVNTVDK